MCTRTSLPGSVCLCGFSKCVFLSLPPTHSLKRTAISYLPFIHQHTVKRSSFSQAIHPRIHTNSSITTHTHIHLHEKRIVFLVQIEWQYGSRLWFVFLPRALIDSKTVPSLPLTAFLVPMSVDWAQQFGIAIPLNKRGPGWYHRVCLFQAAQSWSTLREQEKDPLDVLMEQSFVSDECVNAG